MLASSLTEIPGIGKKRYQQLLHYFGSVKGIAGASFLDLQKIPGISSILAQNIYDFFRKKD